MSSIYGEHVLGLAREDQSYAKMHLALWRRERLNCQHPGCAGCVELDLVIEELRRLSGEPKEERERYP